MLGDLDNIKISCRSSLRGDIVSWDKEPWNLTSPYNRSERELLNFDKDVCKVEEQGLFLVPLKLSFYESQHMCKKLSGNIVSYTEKSGLDEIVHFLASSNIVKSNICFEDNEDAREVNVFTSGTDEYSEGVWETRERDKIMVNDAMQ